MIRHSATALLKQAQLGEFWRKAAEIMPRIKKAFSLKAGCRLSARGSKPIGKALNHTT
jgi:hypothetical protein